MRYHFGDCVFDASREELRRQGKVMPTTPQALKVLDYLLEHRDRVVSRDELLEQCWPDSYVSDATLTNCLWRVRRAIAQRGSGSPLIQTVHRRGYRFVADVTEADDAAPVSAALPRPLDASATPLTLPASDASPPLEAPPPVPLPTPNAAATAERRPLSVLSCLLAEAERLAQQLDVEDHYELMDRLRTVCVEMVRPYGGHVAQQSDAALVIYFGYPQAYEDAALRAVHSALAVTRAVQDGALGAWAGLDTPLAVQGGIATDMMIVRSGDDPEVAPPPLGGGRASSLALRLGLAAAPGTVVISDATARLVRGFFTCKVLEDVRLFGSDAQLAYEVRGESALQSRLEVESLYGLTPYVGREAEVALLAERWRYVQEGLGQVVLVRGEAGMGKSRLVQVWQEQVGDALPLAWSCRCSPYHQHTALYPLVELLHRALYEASSPSPAVQLESLEALLDQHGFDLAETVPLLADLISLPLPSSRYTPLNLMPQRQRERTLETLVSLFVDQAAASPVLFVVEDLHWADPSTLEFLELLMQQVATVSLMLVLTCRPQFTAPWEQRTTMTPLVLQRLTRMQTAQMIRQVAAGKRLPVEVVEQVIEKTDGVPLFVEELTRMVLESGELAEGDDAYTLRGDRSHLTIPATLHDSLMARLDRLPSAKGLAQQAAVLGRQCSYAVLHAVTQLDEVTLQRQLEHLVEAELVYQRGVPPQATYTFKHALIQDAAYQSLLKSTRQQYHKKIAQVLTEHFPDTVETQPELLAHHYTEAGQAEAAISYWQQAGQRAIQRSAYVEAITHLRQCLALLTTLPETRENLQQELDLEETLGRVLMNTKGYTTPEAEHVYMRARALCEQLGDIPRLIVVLRGLLLYYMGSGDLLRASQLGAQMLGLAEAQPDPALLVLAHYYVGNISFYRGELFSAQPHLTKALNLYDALPAHADLARRFGVDIGTSCHFHLALLTWQLGYPDQARQHSQAALTRAEGLSHPYSFNCALAFTAHLHQFCREVSAVYEQAQATITFARRHGFTFWLACGTCFHGWALALQGQPEAGLVEMRQGLHARLDTSMMTFPYALGLLAEVYQEAGDAQAGLNTLAEALAMTDATELRLYEPELYRLQGDIHLHQAVPDASQAEACFHRALDSARQQQAKSWELRASTSLARLWQSQGKRQDAYDLLAPVYNWFAEGFDTADLQEARALLMDRKN